MAGEETVKALIEDARRHGYQVRTTKMEHPLKIAGVGTGTQDCVYQTQVPVAVPTDSGHSELLECEAPVVNAVPKQDMGSGMEAVVVTVDSGACNAVGPVSVGTHFDVKPTEASKNSSNIPPLVRSKEKWTNERTLGDIGGHVTGPLSIRD